MIYYIVGSMLFVAAMTDILWKKVPNIIILGYFLTGVCILHLEFVFRVFISIILFSILYRLRFFGAGDIKLFSLIIGFLGTYDGVNVTVIALVLAGAGALLYMIFSNQLTIRITMLINYCMRVLATGRIEKYYEYRKSDKHLIPVSPYFLAGFILWRCFC